MPAPTLATTVRQQLGARSELADLLRWTHNDAWARENQPDRKRRTPTVAVARRQRRDSDFVPGGRTDIGIGNDARKHSWAGAVNTIVQIEVRAAHTAHLAGRSHAGLIQPGAHHALSLVMLAVERARINIAHTITSWPANMALELAVLDEIVIIHGLVEVQVDMLKSDWAKGPSDGIAIVADCRNSKKGCPNKVMAGGHSRCGSCDRWYRNTGQEKPGAMLKENVDVAKAAKGRRMERGEGWGDA